jgi:hypothetical protein
MLIKRLDFVSIILLLLVGMSSCINGDRTIGSQLIDDDVSVNTVDSFTVTLSSYLLDSVVTNNKSVALVGEYINPLFGKTIASSYIQFGRPYITQLAENAVFDSLKMTMYYSGYYYGDTLTPISFSLHQVNQSITYPENTISYLYNTTSFSYNTESIGDTTMLIKPKTKDKVVIKMSNVLGNEFFNKFLNYSAEFTSQSDFVDYFKGIAIVPETGNAIVGFVVSDTSMHMDMYYHIGGDVVNIAQHVTFYPYDTQKQFNSIHSDRTSTLIENISESPTLSSATGNYAYLQGGTGIVTRVDFPTLTNILATYKHMQVLRAVLIVQPVGEGGSTQFFPQHLNLYYSNKHNDFLTIVKDSQGNTETGDLYTDQIIPDNSYYAWDITTFVNTLLGTNTSQLNGLIIVPENVTSTFDHVTFADQFRSRYKTQLKLYIASYE